MIPRTIWNKANSNTQQTSVFSHIIYSKSDKIRSQEPSENANLKHPSNCFPIRASVIRTLQCSSQWAPRTHPFSFGANLFSFVQSKQNLQGCLLKIKTSLHQMSAFSGRKFVKDLFLIISKPLRLERNVYNAFLRQTRSRITFLDPKKRYSYDNLTPNFGAENPDE